MGKHFFLILFLLNSYFTFCQNENWLFIKPVDQSSLNDRTPLLLIHGWSYKGKPAPPTPEVWNNFLSYFYSESALKSKFKPYYVYYWANQISDLELAKVMRTKIDSISNIDSNFAKKKFVLLVHSMGGLISRSFMKQVVFSAGLYKGKNGGERVSRLITLGTPHHGSPMANGPARDAKIGLSRRTMLNFIENTVFKSVKYNEVNRTDLHWDNYDNALDYNTYSNEKNDWLLYDINGSDSYDNKIIAYCAKMTPKPVLIPTNEDQFFDLSATILKEDFGMESDGIVPYKSACLDKHTVRNIRTFNNYNHMEVVEGKGLNDKLLFDNIKFDLIDAYNITISPNSGSSEGGQTVLIKIDHEQMVKKYSDISAFPIITFDGISANDIQIVSEYAFSCKTPPHSPGIVDVIINLMDGFVFKLPMGYTYIQPTGVKSFPNAFKDRNILYQNFPNPFNPSTTVKFKISEKGIAKLLIYDIQGKIIDEIFSGFLIPGEYKVNYYTAKISSGTYYYCLETASGKIIKKFIILK